MKDCKHYQNVIECAAAHLEDVKLFLDGLFLYLFLLLRIVSLLDESAREMETSAQVSKSILDMLLSCELQIVKCEASESKDQVKYQRKIPKQIVLVLLQFLQFHILTKIKFI